MKKRYLLPIFVAAIFSSQSWGAACTDGSGAALFCDWGDACWGIDDVHSQESGENLPCGSISADGTTSTLIGKCKLWGSLYTGVTTTGANITCNGTWTGEGKDPGVDYGYCYWGPVTIDPTTGQETGGCHSIKSETERATCERDGIGGVRPNCDNLPTTTEYCDWGPPSEYGEGGCFPIKNADERAACEADGSIVTKCPTTPIQGIQPGITDLIVVPHGRALHISSPGDANVTLYDLSGSRVFGGKVRTGNSVFSLTSQAPGVYYAVVQSGSAKQIVKVTVR